MMTPKIPDNSSFLSIVPLHLCKKLQTFVIEIEGSPYLATCNQDYLKVFEDLLPPKYHNLPTLLISKEEFLSLISKEESLKEFLSLCKQVSNDEDLSIQKLLDFILYEAIKHQSSDIHIESSKTQAQIRIRIDGIMQNLFSLPLEHFLLLSSSLKLECSLDIHENRKPQDGRFSRIFEGNFYDFRFSSLPTTKGESLVVRILCKDSQNFSLHSLGFPQTLHSMIALPYGLIFITGPTGSGKSTTLYAMLEQIKGEDKKIITLEDPVEYDLELLTQVAICEKYGFGFKEALRSILRQDPDVIMVGEIRDQETLSLALRASLTGHLVFSTLHTNNAISTIERLLDMQAKPYLVASILRLIIAQRLARKLCPHCKEIINEIPDFVPNKFKNGTFFIPKGCNQCGFKGYKGRVLIYEILPICQDLQSLIAKEAPKEEILKTLQSKQFQTLFDCAIKQASLGVISLEEVLRITHYEI